ncbi:MAG: hypothetical protein JO327_04205 [Nitrososphaeraceae archaeon]|nr:hypothetical protein [Nitrososphaeraceae archaeon]
MNQKEALGDISQETYTDCTINIYCITCSKLKPFEIISAITLLALSLGVESLVFVPRVYNFTVDSLHFSPVIRDFFIGVTRFL